MTDYVKSTNFASKDSLATGNPLKIVKGTEIDTEFNNIATAVATKADIVSPTFTGTPSAPTAAAGSNSTQLANTAYVKTELDNHTVSTAQIEDLAVTTAKIADSAVTTAKIADSNVTTAKLADSNVTTAKIADSNVTTVKIADSAVTTAKVNDAAVTAAKLSGAQAGDAPVYGARAWVNFNGTGSSSSNQTINGSGNVSSVYKNGTGNYTINFTTAMPDANYAITILAGDQNNSGNTVAAVYVSDTRTASSVQIRTYNTAGDTLIDSNPVSVVIFR